MTDPNYRHTADLDIDETKDIAEARGKAESEVIVKYLLGLDVSGNLDKPDRERVTRQIATRMKMIRSSIDDVALGKILDPKIDSALKTIAPEAPTKPATAEQKQEAIVQALYASVGKDVMHSLLAEQIRKYGGVDTKNTLRQNVTFAGADTTKGDLAAGNYGINFHLTSRFWSENSFKDADELAKGMEGKSLNQLGLIITAAGGTPVRSDTKLSKNDAELISKLKLHVALYATNHGEIQDPTVTPKWSVNVDRITRMKTSDKAPAAMQNINFAAMNKHQLQTVLEYSDGGAFPYWEICVNGANSITPTTAYPGGTDSWAKVITDRIFAKAGNPPHLSKTAVDLYKIQAENTEQKKIADTLQKGTQNDNGAAFAAILIAQHPELADAMMAPGNEKMKGEKKKMEEDKKDLEDERTKMITQRNTLTGEKNAIQGKIDIYARADDLKGADTLTINTFYNGTDATYESMENEGTNLAHDYASVSIGGSPPASKSVYVSFGTAGTSGSLNVAGKKESDSLRTKIQAEQQKVTQELTRYKKIAKQLVDIRDLCLAAGLTSYCAELKKYVDTSTGTIRKDQIKSDFDVKKAAETILTQLQAGAPPLDAKATLTQALTDKDDELRKKLDEIKEKDKAITAKDHDIHEKDKEIKKAGGGMLEGDDAQKAVLAAYYKKMGLDDPGAAEAAQRTYNRAFTDQEMVKMNDEMMEDLFGEVEAKEESDVAKSYQLIGMVGKYCGIKPSYKRKRKVMKEWYDRSPFGETKDDYEVENEIPDWNTASYKQLCTAYFTFKRLLADDCPDHMKMPKTAFQRDQMKTIATILSTRFSQALERDMYTNLSADDKKLLDNKHAANKKLTLTESVHMFLDGPPPAHYNGKIEKILKKIDEEMRPGLFKRSLFATGGGLATAAKWTALTAVPWTAGKVAEQAGGLLSTMKANPGKTALAVLALGCGAGPFLAAGAILAWNSAEGGGGGGHGAHSSTAH